MVVSVERYLKKESYGFSAINSIEFAGTREVLKYQTISTIINTESQTRERSAQPMSHSELPANCSLSSIFANSTISGNIEINRNNHASRKPPVFKESGWSLNLVIAAKNDCFLLFDKMRTHICRNILRERYA